MDLVPKGRDEAGHPGDPPFWVRRRGEYGTDAAGQLFTAANAADRLAVTRCSRGGVSLSGMTHDDSSLTRRQVLGGAGVLAVAGPVSVLGSARPARAAEASGGAADGTPEQIHLTWGADPASSVTVSWASPAEATRPRVLLRRGGSFGRTVPAVQRTYTDGINGETVWTYHAEITGLAPDTAYAYTGTAENDASAVPLSATFTTAPRGRAPFRFTSFGDLATPNTKWVLSYGQSADAVAAVESFQPLFHLLNGDLCYADLNPTVQPEVWRDFGNNNQSSAANRA
jgi:phosphodiesterase/alkaline phosphatase D-like protein